MKKFFLVLMLLCSFAVPGFANSFDQQPQRFVCVDTSQKGRRYVDLDSVQVVQYAPRPTSFRWSPTLWTM